MEKEILSFPGLGLEIPLSRVAFSIGGFDIYWYGITFALAFALGLWYYYTHTSEVGVHPNDALDVILWAMVGAIVGARLYYVAFEWDMYKNDLLKIFALREGGLGFYGGVIGGILAAIIACKVKKLPILPLMDVGLPALLLGQGIGRWGNFFNMEAFGCNTDLPWGMTSKSIRGYLTTNLTRLESEGMSIDPTRTVHPCFLYEFLWCMLGFALLALVIRKHRRFDGELALWYLGWNGFGRFFIESLRTDSLMWGGVRVSQALGAVMFFAAAAALLLLGSARRKALATAAAPAAEAAAEATADADAPTESTEAESGTPETAPEAKPNRWTLYRDTAASRERMADVDKQLADEKEKAAEKKRAKHAKAAKSEEPQADAEAPEASAEAAPSDGETDTAAAPEASDPAAEAEDK